MAFVHQMQVHGLLVCREDEFGEHEVALRRSAVTWHLELQPAMPNLAWRSHQYTKLAAMTKLETLMHMVQNSWKPSRPHGPRATSL